MGNDRNLQELLAAINSGDNSPSSSRGFPISPAPAAMQQPAQTQTSQMSQPQPNIGLPAAQYNNNYHELVNLLGDQTTQQPAAVPQPSSHANIPVASFQNSAPNIPNTNPFSQHSQTPQTHKPTPASASMRKSSAQGLSQQPPAPQPQRQAIQKRQNHRMDITAELQQVIANRQPNAAGPPQPNQTAAAAAAAAAAASVASQTLPAQARSRAQQLTVTQRQQLAAAAARQASAQQNSSRGPNNPNAQARTANATQQQVAAAAAHRARNRQITQEQVIVGHFCRHSIKTLSRVMQGNPAAQQTEARLKEHIRIVWAQWVRGVITRTQLLDTVASFVRNTSKEASHIDVVREFKSWYEREFEMQRQRSNSEHANSASRVAQSQGVRRVTQQQHPPQQPQQQSQPAPGRAAHPAAVKPTATTPTKKELTVAPVAAPSVKPSTLKTKQEESVVHPSTAGKTLSASASTTPRPAAGRGTGGTGKGAANKGGAAKNAASKAGGGRGAAAKSVAGKTVGGKGVTRPSFGTKSDAATRAAGNAAAPNTSTLPTGTGDVDSTQPTRPRVGGKTISGPSKTPATKKKATAAKVSPKGTQTKPGAKGSPVSSARGKPATTAAEAPSSTPKATVGDKRGASELNTNSTGSASPASKKAKTTGKAVKAAAQKPKIGISSDTEPLVKPRPPKGDEIKKIAALPKKGVPSAGTSVATTAQAQKAGAATATGNAPAASAPSGGDAKKVKRVDDELAVTNGLVDFEAEENQMGLEAQDTEVVVVEDNSYSEDMVLVGGKLRSKMQKIAKRFGLDDVIGKDILEMVSLAVEERLRLIVEGLRESANLRTGRHKEAYITESVGINVYEKMERMREEEERSLVRAAEMRVKRRNEKKEQELRKQSGEASGPEKKKETNASSEADRREKMIQERKRKEHSSQRDALSGLLAGIDKRRKKPNVGKGLAPLAPLGGLEPLGKVKGLASLPPIQKRGSESYGSAKEKAAAQLKALGPLTKLGRKGSKEEEDKELRGGEGTREPLKLVDAVFFLENEVNSRKSALLYKWYARLGITH